MRCAWWERCRGRLESLMNGFFARGLNASAALLTGVLAAACGGGDTADAAEPSRIGGGVGGSMFTEKALDVRLDLSGTILTVTTLDGGTPVMTDAWLYTLEGGRLAPLTGFQ